MVLATKVGRVHQQLSRVARHLPECAAPAGARGGLHFNVSNETSFEPPPKPKKSNQLARITQQSSSPCSSFSASRARSSREPSSDNFSGLETPLNRDSSSSSNKRPPHVLNNKRKSSRTADVDDDDESQTSQAAELEVIPKKKRKVHYGEDPTLLSYYPPDVRKLMTITNQDFCARLLFENPFADEDDVIKEIKKSWKRTLDRHGRNPAENPIEPGQIKNVCDFLC